jgi:hypothetical protein
VDDAVLVVVGALVVRLVEGAWRVVGETLVAGVVVAGECVLLLPSLAMTTMMMTIAMMATAATAAPIHLARPRFWGR